MEGMGIRALRDRGSADKGPIPANNGHSPLTKIRLCHLMKSMMLTAINHLHEEDVLVAVVPQHVVIHLGHDPVLVLAVQEPDVRRVDFVLVLDCCK